MLHDHPHYSGAAVFVRQLREQHRVVGVRWADFARHSHLPAWKIYRYRIRQSGKIYDSPRVGHSPANGVPMIVTFCFLPLQTSQAANANREIENLGTIDQWKRRDIQYSRVSGYDLTYAQYCKYPS